MECLSARGFSSCGRRANGRWTDFSPPFSACCGAMRFNGGTVDQNLRRRPTSLSQCAKQIDPHALRGPAHVSIIECLPRAIFRGRIDPTGTWLQNLHDAADHTAIIDARFAPRIGRQMRLDLRKLRFRQPKLVPTHLCLLFGSRESRHYVRANTFMGPDPRSASPASTIALART